ncbi:MAG TPA: type B 50S ribosomal protein L31 [Saprospiraceae bacterium]|nr:type B 50S ribosomal protein L31 [Saprospiraceae bacterium]HMQ82729.1 type B 50S ribosomal protein L31 [Saprospiraceae bacterium]
MKKGIHPESYRMVVFKDLSSDEGFLGRSCASTKDTVVWEDGKEYPLIKMEISSFTHPFFTGKMKFVDTAGRIDKFNKKFANSRFAAK